MAKPGLSRRFLDFFDIGFFREAHLKWQICVFRKDIEGLTSFLGMITMPRREGEALQSV
jgi:hypothetical protein